MIISLSGLHLVGWVYVYQTVSTILRMGVSSYVIRHNTAYLDTIGLMCKRFYFRNPSAQKWRNIRNIWCVECFHPENGSCSVSQNSKATSYRYSILNSCVNISISGLFLQQIMQVQDVHGSIWSVWCSGIKKKLYYWKLQDDMVSYSRRWYSWGTLTRRRWSGYHDGAQAAL
jgi:hypothetical protein